MPHSQADFALDAFFVQTAKQKKSQIRESVTMTVPCHKLWPAEEYHWQLHNALRATTSGTYVVNVETDSTTMLLYMVYVYT